MFLAYPEPAAMSRRKARPDPLHDLVPHPRYGDAPTTSGLTIPEATIRSGHWRYRDDTLFPQSVLIADTTRQREALYPRLYYVDVLRHCRACTRRFLFFAREQRYWYETLGFDISADCVHCPDCRRSQRATQRRLRRYSDMRRIAEPDAVQLRALVDDALHLFEHGVLRDVNALGQLKNRALRELPEYRGTHALASMLAETRARSGA